MTSGLSLIEVLIAAVVLVIVAVPIGAMLSQSNRGVKNADKVREGRYMLSQVLMKVESADFVTLYENFGAGLQPPPTCPRVPESPAAMKGSVVEPGKDPLLLGTELRDALSSGG